APSLSRVSGLDRTDLLRTESFSIRAREWSAALDAFGHHPILGTGPDTFEYSFPRYRNRADGAELGLQIADKPHNVFLEHATDANPTAITYRLGAGFAAEAQGAESADPSDRAQFLSRALDRYGQARRMAPPSLLAVLGLARTETLFGQGVDPSHFDAADNWWSRAAADDPRDWEVHNQYGLMLNSWSNARSGDRGLREQAASELEKTLQIKGNYVPALVNLAKIRMA